MSVRRGLATAGVVMHIAAIGSVASAQPLTTIRPNGSPENRIDIVVLGDGYTAGELLDYDNDVERLIEALFAEEPFASYRTYFNVHTVDVVSRESGADHPALSPPVFKDTALDGTYDCAGIQRLLCVSGVKVNAVLSTIQPDMRDLVLIVVNDTEYGGSGGAFAVASTHFAAVDVVKHELGHSFGLLADEYGGPPPPFCDNRFEPPEPNVTRADGSHIKWAAWIEPGTPLPTSGPTTATPGLYEGAKYCDTGLFRPTYDSKMRSLFVPFEQVNSEQLVKRIYNWVSPIDAATPASIAITLLPRETQTLRVETPRPSGHALEVTWFLDGVPRATGNEWAVNGSAVTAGSHSIEVVVTDPTPFVRDDPDGILRDTKRWDIVVPDIEPAATLAIGTPNELSDWGIGTRQTLGWTYDGTATHFNVEISRDGGGSWELIQTVENSGPYRNFDWTVTGPGTALARLRVTAVGDERASDTNDADIRIAEATITVIYPLPGAAIPRGAEQQVFVVHNLGAGAPVALDVSADEGQTWRTAVERTITEGTTTSWLPWTVDLVDTNRARVRIRALDGSGAVGVSDSFAVSSDAVLQGAFDSGF